MKKIFSHIIIVEVFFVFVISTNTLSAQINTTDTANCLRGKKSEMDVMDYINLIRKKTPSVKSDSCRKQSLGPFVSPFLFPGYTLVTGFIVGLAANVSFYTYKGDDRKISSILSDNYYSQYNQYVSQVSSNIWTKNAKFNLLGDWRYYNFPTNTFGLGSKTTFSDQDAVKYSYMRFYEIVMRKIVGDLSGGMGAIVDYHWNISEINPTGNILTDLQNYDNNSIINKSSISSGISFNLQYDNRLNCNNPDQGTYANLHLRNNLTALGSDANWQSLLIDARHYIQTSERTGNVLAFWSYDYFTLSGKPPYFDLPSLGWDTYNNTGRGYVQGRYTGLNMISFETEYRFRLTKNGFLGGVVFSNASTFTEWPNNKFEKINPGAGFGLRIKINKLSKTNLCVDYGFGTEGSRGLLFNLDEVF